MTELPNQNGKYPEGADNAQPDGDITASGMLETLMRYALTDSGGAASAASALLERFRGLRGVFDAEHSELESVPGVTAEASILIRLIRELAIQYHRDRLDGREMIGNNAILIDYLELLLSGERLEKFIAVYLDARNRIISIDTLAEGTIDQTMVYPRRAIELAFERGARAVILAHNHPSRDATPTSEDTRLIEALDKAAISVGLIIHDHLIIAGNSHFSASRHGWIIGSPPHFLKKAAASKHRSRASVAMAAEADRKPKG